MHRARGPLDPMFANRIRALQRLCLRGGSIERVQSALRQRLGFVVDVRAVNPGDLPRFELKSRRIVRE